MEFKKWSDSINKLAENALNKIVDSTIASIEKRVSEKSSTEEYFIAGFPKSLEFQLKQDRESNKIFLPIRPILLGGDDLTFVCESRIALNMTQAALDVFSKSKVEVLGKIGACAGIAISRTHSPFSRVYELAESLCGNAKASS